MIRKKLYAAVLAAAVSASVIPACAAAEGTVLRETVLYSWDFASADQTSAEENEKDIPVLYGAAEYAEDTANIRLNHKNGASGVKTELSVPVTAETSENIITVEFDLNIGSGSGLYYTYRIEGSGGEPVAELHFTPYSSSDTTAYLRIGGNDVVFDETDGNGDIITTVNQQIKNCISSETSDGMNAAVTHIKNVIDLTEGSAEVTISSGTKSGTFTGEISAQDIALLDMNVNKVNHSRYIYLDNIRISQLRNVELPPMEELVHRITAEADGELTQIDTSRLVYGDHVSMMSITTSSEGRLVKSYTTGLADSVTVATSGADTVEIVPVYEYTGLEDTAFNTAEGAELEAPNALGVFEDARYDISLQKADGKLTDIYINEAMVGNNIEQTGRGRGTPKGSLYTAKDIKIEGGKIRINTQRDEYNGTTYPDAPVSSVTVKACPETVERKTKITILGDSLVAEYYGSRKEEDLGSNQTGWGQQLSNFIDTDEYEIVNLANSGHYAKILYETAMGGAVANSLPGDIVLVQVGYNDRVRSDETEMAEYMAKMAEDANAAGLRLIFVSPPATADDETKYGPGYKNPIDTSAADYVNTSYSYPVRYSETVKSVAAELGAGFIDLSRYSYDYLTSLYGCNVDIPRELYKQNLGVADGIHLSWAGAMKWASFIAQSLYDDAYISSMNTEFDYTVTDNDGNEIVCRVYEDGAVDDIDNRFRFYTVFRSLDSIGIKTKKQAENRVYAALYHADGTLIGVRACDCNGTEQTLEFTVPGEA